MTNDIYVSFLEEAISGLPPKSLGKKINLPGFNENEPILAADGVITLFQQRSSWGLGENDIWMSKRLDDSWQK
jgi:hypothetical protein